MIRINTINKERKVPKIQNPILHIEIFRRINNFEKIRDNVKNIYLKKLLKNVEKGNMINENVFKINDALISITLLEKEIEYLKNYVKNLHKK